MPLLCGLWLKTIKYLQSFIHESSFSSAPVGLQSDTAGLWIARCTELETGSKSGPFAPEHSPTPISFNVERNRTKSCSGHGNKFPFLIFNIVLRRQVGPLRKPVEFSAFYTKIGAHTYLGLTPQEGTRYLPISPSDHAFSGGRTSVVYFFPVLCPHSGKCLPPTFGGLPLAPPLVCFRLGPQSYISPPPPLEGIVIQAWPITVFHLPGHSDWPKHVHVIQAGPIRALPCHFLISRP